MTYSYYLRRWALEKMNENLLGRDTIALVCGVAPRTISTWTRAEQGVGPYLLATHRESDRAIAILLFEKFPTMLDQVARLCRTTPRAIIEWRRQVRSARYKSELIWATRLALTTLHYRLDDYFEIKDGVIVQTKGHFPGSEPLQEMIFFVYDTILLHVLARSVNEYVERRVAPIDRIAVRVGMGPGPRLASSHIPSIKRPLGPHKYRGARLHSDGHVDYDQKVLQQREYFGGTVPSVIDLHDHYRDRINRTVTLQDLMEHLDTREIKKVKYKITYAGRTARWSEHYALGAYLWRVHPESRTSSKRQRLA
jgi:hypothetical protein